MAAGDCISEATTPFVRAVGPCCRTTLCRELKSSANVFSDEASESLFPGRVCREWAMSRSRRFRLLMSAAILIVILNSWIAIRSLRTMFVAESWLNHTMVVLAAVEGANEQIAITNSALRGYLLIASETSEQRFEGAKQKFETQLGQMADYTADNASQQMRIQLLRQAIADKLTVMDRVHALRSTRPLSAMPPATIALAVADSPNSNVSVRYLLLQFENEERRLLADREGESQAARRKAVASITVAFLLDVVLMIVAFELMRRSGEDREQLAQRAVVINKLNGELQGLNSELEERVAQRTRELEVSNQELQAFSYSVSHDLRAPLRTIDGFSLALEEDFAEVLNDEGRDYIQRVRNGVQRMGMLIDALLQLSRVTRSEVQRERVNLSQMASLIFDELRVNDPGSAVRFLAEENVMADADPRLMRVAFENLLGNALKFTSKTPEAVIRLCATSRGEQTVYSIRDNGAGFDMQYVDRLFTAFQRLHGDRDFKGSGIGLATVSRIIRRHGGEIWAEGETGKGASFFFTLTAETYDGSSRSEQQTEMTRQR